MSNLKFCEDCHHYVENKDSPDILSKCAHPEANPSIVTRSHMPTCSEARRPMGQCGYDAELFEEAKG